MSVAAPIWGADVSDHQGEVDFPRMKREGFEFCGIKASEGIGWWAKNYKENVTECRQAGVVPMPYHFLWGNDPVRQVQTFLNRVGNPEGKILSVDVETYQGQTPPRAKHLEGFLVELARRVGKAEPIVVYSGDWYYKRPEIANFDLAAFERRTGIKTRVWTTPDSGYVEGPGLASALYRRVPRSEWETGFGGRPTTIMQFTAEARGAGEYPLDANAFAGTRAQLLGLVHSAKTVAPGPDGDRPPRDVERPADLHKPTPGHEARPKPPAERITLPEPEWDRGSGWYVQQHPTHYNLRADIRELALWLLNHPAVRGRISVCTYRDHPPGWGLDAVSFDVWAWAGRGHWLAPELRKTVHKLLFNKPGKPHIRWCISGGGMWTPNGWQDAPVGPAGSDADHIGHWHGTYF